MGDWNQELAKRVAQLSRHGVWLMEDREVSSSSWWRFHFFDTDFYERSITFFKIKQPEQKFPPIVSKEYLKEQGIDAGTNDTALQSQAN